MTEPALPPRAPYGRGQLVNVNDAAFFVMVTWKVRLYPATIRQWAHRRHIGTYSRRRERYDLREVVAYARARGLIPRPKTNTREPKHGTGT